MSQHYSDPSREAAPYALPDVEVFYYSAELIAAEDLCHDDGEPLAPGWYWWTCLPGCMPGGVPMGPFETEQEALDNAQDWE